MQVECEFNYCICELPESRKCTCCHVSCDPYFVFYYIIIRLEKTGVAVLMRLCPGPRNQLIQVGTGPQAEKRRRLFKLTILVRVTPESPGSCRVSVMLITEYSSDVTQDSLIKRWCQRVY